MAPRPVAVMEGAPRSPSRTVAANSVWQLLTFAARAISGLGVVVMVARAGGPRSLGIFQFALTFTAMLPFYYGIPSLLAREVARRPDESRKWVEAGTLIALLAGGLFTALFVVGTLVVGASAQTATALSIAAIGMAFDGMARVQFAAFWAWERFKLETIATALQELAFLVATAVILASGGGVRGALIAFTVSRALGALAGWVVVGRHLGAVPIPRAHLAFLRETARRCTPFAISDTLTLTYMRADSVMLGIFQGPVAVGLYQAGTNLVLYMNVLARCINYALYPRMSKAWPGRRDDFARLRDASFRIIGLISMPIAVASLLLAPKVFRFLYGQRFDRAVLTYQLLVLVIPVRMLSHTFSLALAAMDRQTRRTVAVTTAAAANVALNLYYIPRWSYLGAAITTVICETGLLATYAIILRQAVGRSALGEAVAVPALATVPMAVAILATAHQQLFVSMTAGAVAFGVAMLAIAASRVSPEMRHQPKAMWMGMVRGMT
jgi:O-antigen/teichoic acid export membrane protein